MSLEKIARQQNVSATQLQSTVSNAIQSAVNQAVSDKNLTQQQGTDFMQFLQKHPGVLHRILDREFRNA